MILGIPVLSQYHLLSELIASAESGTVRPSEYLIIDNGGLFSPPPGDVANRIGVRRPGRNLGVAASWNAILRYAHGQGQPAVISNDDVRFHPETFEEMCRGLSLPLVDLVNGLGWALFGQTPECTRKVGWYDENFYPAYFEDCDYHWRLRLSGAVRMDCLTRSPHHVSSATLNAASDKREFNDGYARNQAYYVRKWGGPAGQEVFRTPFDGSPPANSENA